LTIADYASRRGTLHATINSYARVSDVPPCDLRGGGRLVGGHCIIALAIADKRVSLALFDKALAE
jgi:hypothetical protein